MWEGMGKVQDAFLLRLRAVAPLFIERFSKCSRDADVTDDGVFLGNPDACQSKFQFVGRCEIRDDATKSGQWGLAALLAENWIQIDSHRAFVFPFRLLFELPLCYESQWTLAGNLDSFVALRNAHDQLVAFWNDEDGCGSAASGRREDIQGKRWPFCARMGDRTNEADP